MAARGTIIVVAVAAGLAACGGKTERDFIGTGTGGPPDSGGNVGGTAGSSRSGDTGSSAGGSGGAAETADTADVGGVAGTADTADVGGVAGTADTADVGGVAGTADTAGVGGAAGSSGAAACIPNCEGKECGSDGCGSFCAPGCSISQTCNAGQCDDLVYGPEGQSCSAMTGTECNGESCCTSIVVPGGTFPMGRGTETCTSCTDGCPSGTSCREDEQPEHPATVSSFALDRYEVTVGRFRAFVESYDGSPPPAGAGAHPLISSSGWDSGWDGYLPQGRFSLGWSSITCWSQPSLESYETWTDTAGANETYPMNCVSWYEAFAFCIWDGGRLPTEAEWEYAAAGGDENRVYPWGKDVIEPLPATYGSDWTPYLAVGSEPSGNGRWGHADLAGSMQEWALDWYATGWYTTTETGCSDCANLTASSSRVTRGGGGAGRLRAASRHVDSPDYHSYGIGFRCAKSAE